LAHLLASEFAGGEIGMSDIKLFRITHGSATQLAGMSVGVEEVGEG
jgi:hypothetical protein